MIRSPTAPAIALGVGLSRYSAQASGQSLQGVDLVPHRVIDYGRHGFGTQRVGASEVGALEDVA